MAALWCSSTSLAEGDLSERARRRALEIANDADLRIWAPKNFGTERPRGEIMTEWHVLRSVDHPATGVWLGVVVLWMKFLPTGPGESPPVGYLLLGGLLNGARTVSEAGHRVLRRPEPLSRRTACLRLHVSQFRSHRVGFRRLECAWVGTCRGPLLHGCSRP